MVINLEINIDMSRHEKTCQKHGYGVEKMIGSSRLFKCTQSKITCEVKINHEVTSATSFTLRYA